MKRTLLVGLTTLAILSGFAACGKPPVPCDPDTLTEKPQVCPDRDSLGFAQEFGSGTFIGQKPQDSLIIRNGGIADLNVTTVNYTGDSEFQVTTEPDTLPTAVKGNKYFYIRVIFAPTESKRYSGTITMSSNAENAPMKTFGLSGCGVPTDGGVSACYRVDGGP
ncbi:MAG: hypothetical protein QM817_20115 [Archangium sp.]